MKIAKLCLLFLCTSLSAHHKHTFINNAPYKITIMLTFYPSAKNHKEDSAEIAVEANSKKTYESSFQLKSVAVELSEHTYGITLNLAEKPSWPDSWIAPGDTAWTYNVKNFGTESFSIHFFPSKGVRRSDGELNPTHMITNNSSQKLKISLQFYSCDFNDNDSVEEIIINPGQTIRRKNQCQIEYISAEGSYGKKSGYQDARLRLSTDNKDLTFYSSEGRSTEWTYSDDAGLIPIKGVKFAGRQLLDGLGNTTNASSSKSSKATHTITNKAEGQLLVKFKFYGCDDTKEIWVKPGKTANLQAQCQLKYIYVEEFTRASRHSGYGDITELYLSEHPALFQFHASKGQDTQWIYGEKGHSLVPTKGIRFIGKEKLDLLEKNQ